MVDNKSKKTRTFFFLSYGISWLIWLVGLFFPEGPRFAFFPLGTLGPALAAIILSVKGGNIGPLLKTIKPHRIKPGKLIVMFTLTPLAMVIPLLYFPMKNTPIPPSFIIEMLPFQVKIWQVLILIPISFPLLMAGNLGEEIGWRGYATERLLSRYGIISGSLILGVLNAFWHAPLYWLISNPIYNPASWMFAGFLLFEIGYTILSSIMWKEKQTIYTGLMVHTPVTIASLLLPTWGHQATILYSGVLMLLIALFYYSIVTARK